MSHLPDMEAFFLHCLPRFIFVRFKVAGFPSSDRVVTMLSQTELNVVNNTTASNFTTIGQSLLPLEPAVNGK